MAYTATLTKLSENLITAFENTIFSHSGNIGDSRERVLIEYLRKVMAHRYGFQSGEVFDEEDNKSGQIDVIIYDNLFSTVFTDGTDKILAPIESTFGIISVKSIMGTRELDDAIAGIEKYNSLKRPIIPTGKLQITPDISIGFTGEAQYSHQININCIFAFDTTVATETILEKIKQSGVIDFVVIPDKLCVIGRAREDFYLLDENEIKYGNNAIKTESAVSLFILYLQIHLSKNRLIARNLEGPLLGIINSVEL